MIGVSEITKKLERLPYDKRVAVFEFIDFLEHKTRRLIETREMSNDEVLIAAERTGSFDFLDDPLEDIYSLTDGSPL